MYYDVQTCRLDARNDKGDAALHMAARWGYEGIIQVLLENGASTDVLNKSKDSPLQCALNSKVRSRSDRVSDLVPTSDQLKSPLCFCLVDPGVAAGDPERPAARRRRRRRQSPRESLLLC